MQYLAILRYGPDVEELVPGTPEFLADLARYERFDEAAGDAVLGGAALDHSRTAVTVRPGDPPLVTAGPFAETTEVIGGVYALEAADLDDAVELARRIPAAEDGSVELRPLVQWDQRVPPAGTPTWLALLLEVEDDAAVPGTAAWDAGGEAHRRFGEEAGDAVVAGAALHPSATATTVRVRDGEVQLADAAVPAGTPALGGLYQLAAPDRDAAVALAARIPVGPQGAVEVRPVLALD